MSDSSQSEGQTSHGGAFQGDSTYVSCPSCDNTLLTERYRERFGRCMSCYLRDNKSLEDRIRAAC